ncbi:MAG: ABC transporter ATP-binding protein [bacterium]
MILMNEPIVQITEATRTYHLDGTAVSALRGVTMQVRQGEFISIAGPSGSGKSTLLHLMGGVDLPTTGEVRLFGSVTHRLTDRTLSNLRLLRVGFIFQRFFLLPMLTVEENVMLPMLEAGLQAQRRGERLEDLLSYVGLAHRRRHLPGQLSGGEMQRAAIARALANRPHLLLADEPTGEVDQQTGQQIGRLMQRINGEGVAIVLVTHNPELAALASTRLTMRDGLLS